jgi:hypothetical protein
MECPRDCQKELVFDEETKTDYCPKCYWEGKVEVVKK